MTAIFSLYRPYLGTAALLGTMLVLFLVMMGLLPVGVAWVEKP